MFTVLPLECQAQIFNWLTTADQLQARTVCKQWKELISSILTSLTIRMINNDFLPDYSLLFPNVKMLTYIELADNPNICINFSKFSKLETVRVISPFSGLECLDNLECPNLIWEAKEDSKYVCLINLLYYVEITPKISTLTIVNKIGWCPDCLPFYGRMNNLKKLVFEYCHQMSLTQLGTIAGCLKLEELTIRDCDFSPDIYDSPEIVATFLSFPELKILEITDDLINPITLDELITQSNILIILVPRKRWVNDSLPVIKFLDSRSDLEDEIISSGSPDSSDCSSIESDDNSFTESSLDRIWDASLNLLNDSLNSSDESPNSSDESPNSSDESV